MNRYAQMRNRVMLQNPPDTDGSSPTAQDAGGVPSGAWTDFAECWAEIMPLKGRELIAAQQVNSEVTGTMRIRWRDGVTSKMRAVFRTRVFDILAVVNTKERNREIMLYVKEGPNLG